jgi:hypothetical protein
LRMAVVIGEKLHGGSTAPPAMLNKCGFAA